MVKYSFQDLLVLEAFGAIMGQAKGLNAATPEGLVYLGSGVAKALYALADQVEKVRAERSQ